MQRSVRRRALVIAIGLVACAQKVQPPVAGATAPQTVNVGTVVQLDGSSSSDPQGRQLAYIWDLLLLPPGSAATLNNPQSVNPSFRADVAGKYQVRLVVQNSLLSSEPVVLEITAANCGNKPPVVGAVT